MPKHQSETADRPPAPRRIGSRALPIAILAVLFLLPMLAGPAAAQPWVVPLGRNISTTDTVRDGFYWYNNAGWGDGSHYQHGEATPSTGSGGMLEAYVSAWSGGWGAREVEAGRRVEFVPWCSGQDATQAARVYWDLEQRVQMSGATGGGRNTVLVQASIDGTDQEAYPGSRRDNHNGYFDETRQTYQFDTTVSAGTFRDFGMRLYTESSTTSGGSTVVADVLEPYDYLKLKRLYIDFPNTQPPVLATDPSESDLLAWKKGERSFWYRAEERTACMNVLYKRLDGEGQQIPVCCGPQVNMAAQQSVSGTGVHSFWFKGCNWNLQCSERTVSVRIDNDPPTPTIASNCIGGGENGWCQQSAAITWTNQDAHSGPNGADCRRAGSPAPNQCSGYTESNEGEFQLTMTGYDVAQNAGSATPVLVKIDQRPPIVPSVSSSSHPDPGTYYANRRFDFGWPTGDNGPSGYRQSYWQLDGSGPNYIQGGSASAFNIGDGTHTVSVTNQDWAGRTSSATRSFKVDATTPSQARPVVTSGSLGQNGWYLTPVGLRIDSADAHSGVSCETHAVSTSPPWGSCVAEDTWTDGVDGVTTWYGAARDNAGNQMVDGNGLKIKIDQRAPQITNNQGNIEWTNQAPTLDVDFRDPSSIGETASGLWRLEYRIWSGAGQSGTLIRDWTTFWSESAGGDGGTAFYDANWQIPAAHLQQGTNYVSVRVTDQAGRQQAQTDVARIGADFIPPSKANPTVSSGTRGENDWFLTNVGLFIDSADATSDIKSEQHSNTGPGGPWSPQPGPEEDAWIDSSSGAESWWGRAIDHAGNPLVSDSVVIKIDKTDPHVDVSPVGQVWFRDNVDVTLSATDGDSGIRSLHHSLDGGDWVTTGQTQALVPVAGEGVHELRYFAVDEAGRRNGDENDPVTRSIKIDAVPPESHGQVSGVLGQEDWYTSPVQVRLNASDRASGVDRIHYQIDQGGWTSVASDLVQLEVDGQGTHVVRFFATDVAGNADATQTTAQEKTFRIDRLAPITDSSLTGSAGTNGWFRSTVDVSLNAHEPTSASQESGVAAIRYGLDDTAVPAVYTGPFTIADEGAHTLWLAATDRAGNRATPTGRSVQIDLGAPTAARPTVHAGTLGQNGWYTSDITLRIDSHDQISGIACERHAIALNGPWEPSTCLPSDQWLVTQDGLHRYWGQATDFAGWTHTDNEPIAVQVDRTPPTILDLQPDVDWTNQNPQLNIDFADATSGLWKIEYAIHSDPGLGGSMLKGWTPVLQTSADGLSEHTDEWSVDFASLQEGNNHVSVRATDRGGLSTTAMDVTLIQWDEVQPSKANPQVVSAEPGNQGWYVSDTRLGIDSDDATSGVASEWHAGSAIGPWEGGTPEDEWTVSTDGARTWYGRAADRAGNSIVSSGMPIKVDRTRPQSASVLTGTMGNNEWWVSAVGVTLNAMDATSGVAGIHHRTDGIWDVDTGPSMDLNLTSDGTHAVEWYAEDTAGNLETDPATPRRREVKVDRTPPESGAAIVDGTVGSNGWYVSNVTVRVTASDLVSGLKGIWYSLDGQGWTFVELGAFDLTFTSADEHRIAFYAEDIAGNTDATRIAPRTLVFRLDRSAPSTSVAFAGDQGQDGWFVSPVTMSIEAQDDRSGTDLIRYGISNPSMPGVYTGPVTLEAPGPHVIHYASRDLAGNQETPQATNIAIDPSSPDVGGWTQTPGDVRADHTGDVKIEVDVDDEVSGLRSAELRYSYDGGYSFGPWRPLDRLLGTRFQTTIPEPAQGWWWYKENSLHFQVRATDMAGNVRIATGPIDPIQRVAPMVTIVEPRAGTAWHQDAPFIRYTGHDADRDRVLYQVFLSADDGATYTRLDCSRVIEENGTIHEETCNISADEIPDGATYKLQVVANDLLHVQVATSGTFTIDSTRPRIDQMVRPAPGRSYVGGIEIGASPYSRPLVIGNMDVCLRASDPGSGASGVATVEVRMDGTLVGVTDTPSAGLYCVTWPALDAAPGLHTLSAEATDRAANRSSVWIQEVIVIAEAPGGS